MSNYPEFSLLRVPPESAGGNERIYEVADSVARAAIDTSGNNILAWRGDAEPVVSVIPAGVTVTYNGTEYTGTLQPDDASVQRKSRYLVYRGVNEDGDNMYQEYFVVQDPLDDTNVWWEPYGFQSVNLQDLGQLAFEDAVILEKGAGDHVLGEDTQFAATAPAVNVTAPKAGLKANIAKNVAVGADGTANAITGFGTHTTEQFVKSVTASTKKLETKEIQEAGTAVNLQDKVSAQGSRLVKTRITPVGGTETVSKVTRDTAKMVKTTVRGVSGTAETVSKVSRTRKKMVTDTVPNVTGVGTLPAFTVTYDNTQKMVTLGFSAGTLPTLGTAKTFATGGLAEDGAGMDVVEEVIITDKEVAVPDQTDTTVATGELSENGTGATVVNEVTINDKNVATAANNPVDVATGELNSSGTGAAVLHTLDVANQDVATLKSTKTVVASGKTAASDTDGDIVVDGVSSTNGTNPAITGLGTPDTAAALTGVKVTQQPAVEIQAKAEGAGDVDVVTDVKATATAPAVTAGSNDRVKVAAYDALNVQAGDLTDMDDETV